MIQINVVVFVTVREMRSLLRCNDDISIHHCTAVMLIAKSMGQRIVALPRANRIYRQNGCLICYMLEV